MRPDSFTIVVVPHTEKPSFSVRIPFWTLYVAVGLCVIGLASLAYFAIDYRDATAQLAELRRGGQVDIVHEANLRNAIIAELKQEENLRAIISQQQERVSAEASLRADDAVRFNSEVSRLSAQITELEQFKADIRRIVGLEKEEPKPQLLPQPKAEENATPQPGTAGGDLLAIGPLVPLDDSRVALSTSSRGTQTEPTTDQAIRTTDSLIDNTIPQQMADLEQLRQEVNNRVAKVGGDWSSPEQLRRELSNV